MGLEASAPAPVAALTVLKTPKALEARGRRGVRYPRSSPTAGNPGCRPGLCRCSLAAAAGGACRGGLAAAAKLLSHLTVTSHGSQRPPPSATLLPAPSRSTTHGYPNPQTPRQQVSGRACTAPQCTSQQRQQCCCPWSPSIDRCASSSGRSAAPTAGTAAASVDRSVRCGGSGGSSPAIGW